MNTKQWTPIQIAFLLAFGSVQAVADSGWDYDEDRDTIVFTAEGSRSNYIRTKPSINETVAHTGPWYHDEDRDTIVLNVEGSRSNYARTNPSIEAPAPDFDQAYLGQ